MEIAKISDFVLNALLASAPWMAGEVVKGSLSEIGADIFKLIKDKFQKNRDAKTALTYFQKSPSEEKAQRMLRQQLQEFLETDPGFRSELEKIMIDVDANFSNAKINAFGNQNTLAQVAGTIIDIRPDQNSTINFVLNLNGLGDAISKLPTYVPPTNLPNIDTLQYLKFINDVKKTIVEYKIEIEADIEVISDLLKPAVAIERSEQYPNPNRFLQNVIQAIGQKLQEARLFDNFGVTNYQTYESEMVLELPELAQEFEKEEKASFVRLTKKNSSKKNQVATLLEKVANKPGTEYTYYVAYNGWDIFWGMGEYHLQFAISERSKFRDELSDYEMIKISLSPEVVAKLLRALLAFYIRQMRFPQSLKSIKNFGNP